MHNPKKIAIFFSMILSFNFFELKSDENLSCEMCNYVFEPLDIASFRPIPSLQEDIHAQIVGFLSNLQDENVDLSDASEELENLCAEVGSRLGYSSSDTIRSEDKQYLLDMIERIDQLIAHLEKGDDRVIRLQQACSQLKEFLHY